MEKNRKTTVAPYVGAWIETFEHLHNYLPSEVAPYVGAWIETCLIKLLSYPTNSRTLCGCVDWNLKVARTACWPSVAPYVGAWIETNRSTKRLLLATVAPYVGAWIETLVKSRSCVGGYRRTLCGCVDWNTLLDEHGCPMIESHPMWVRGLKQFFVLTVQSYKPKPRIIVLASNIPI